MPRTSPAVLLLFTLALATPGCCLTGSLWSWANVDPIELDRATIDQDALRLAVRYRDGVTRRLDADVSAVRWRPRPEGAPLDDLVVTQTNMPDAVERAAASAPPVVAIDLRITDDDDALPFAGTELLTIDFVVPENVDADFSKYDTHRPGPMRALLEGFHADTERERFDLYIAGADVTMWSEVPTPLVWSNGRPIVALLVTPLSFVADVVSAPIHFVWIVWTAGGHGSPWLPWCHD